jgi:hypothetical protein
MPPIDAAEIRRLIAEHLPATYEPLQLTFRAAPSWDGGDYVVIGDDYGTQLRVLLSSGVVYSVDPEAELPVRFVNSSIERLGQFIRVHQSYAGRAKNDSEVAKVAAELQEELASLDAPAFADPENWWALVLEQTSDGLL